jgi:hypothetical protein
LPQYAHPRIGGCKMEMTVRCALCRPPEAMAAGDLLDHLRLFHPDVYEDVAGDAARDGGAAEPGPALDAPFRHPVVTAREAGTGFRCYECSRPFGAGDCYAERPEGMAGWIPVVVAICMACAGLPAPGAPFIC